MRRILLAGVVVLAGRTPALAQSTNGAHYLNAQQMQTMTSELDHAQALIAKINQTYKTSFTVAPKAEAEARMHMAHAQMEMATALMEMQAYLGVGHPSVLPGGN